jgi:hypothetical protein
VDNNFDAAFSTALLNFNEEAVRYCRGISDVVAHDYAVEYTRSLQERAKGLESPNPRILPGLFEPNRNLIRSTIDRMYTRHFQAVSN